MKTWMRRLRRRSEQGATAVEYALMVALVTVVIAGTVRWFGEAVVLNLFAVPAGM